ncbi:hypothetical protein QC823_15715 [Halomonas vilamensis]|uniref:McrBC 5-methylcytosine restriction system component n=1 Tax=Vreelandella vilamensis TaxID=531309 RepID=A0ABU1H7X6_9GAMM|nr:hypothetical protein [Halomonas vilamensis]MDR5900412.1 hypothetical protein [Halomonas vilamensis]
MRETASRKSSGRQQAFSLLFNMNHLFGRYIASRLLPLARRHGFKLMEKGPRRYLGHEESGRGRLLMRPDISLLYEAKRPVIILDAKWKRIEGPDAMTALSAADLYQMAAYASAYGCSSVLLLYPEQSHLQAGLRHNMVLAGSGAKLMLAAIPIDGTAVDSDLMAAASAARA